MVRILLGVVVGFIVWSIIWVGSDQTLVTLSPEWYGAFTHAAERSLVNGVAIDAIDPMIYLLNLLRSIITSIIAGYMCALAAGEYRRSTMVLGIILVLVGIAVEVAFRNAAPFWYHILFVIFLYPMAMLGGRLRRSS